MACIVCGKQLSSADTNSICSECRQKMIEPEPVPGFQSVFQPVPYQTGWVCPKCGSVYGPMHSECSRCNPPMKIEITC